MVVGKGKCFVTLQAMKTAIIGGGAAGFFLAVNLKEMVPEMEVTILERGQQVLAKVKVSGGGRCNVTNTFREVGDLQTVYPRGHRMMKRLFNIFNYEDAFHWYERHGVPLVVQEDECVFPQAQDSQVVIDCLTSLARRQGVNVLTGRKITSVDEVREYDFVAVTTGGSPRSAGLQWLADCGHEQPVPSLFSFLIEDGRLRELRGLVVDAEVKIAGTKLRAEGPLLLTHWGMSGPAVLRLSSYAARWLAERDYRAPLSVRWVAAEVTEAVEAAGSGGRPLVSGVAADMGRKRLTTYCPWGLPQRLWAYLVERALGGRSTVRWCELTKKDVNRLVNILSNDTYEIAGRAAFKEEFVTCGGVSLKAVNPATLESRHVPRLYFAGEVLDIDGVTGGFNFQAAWTTAYTVAQSICNH